MPIPNTPIITNLTEDTGTPGDWVTNDANPTITITADTGTTVTVNYTVGEILFGWGIATETDTAGIFEFTVPKSLPEDTYAFSAFSTNVADESSPPSTDLTVTIDQTAPATPVITGFIDDTFDEIAIAPGGITTDATPAVVITAEHGSSVEVYLGGELVGLATETGTKGTFTFSDLADYEDGTYVFTAVASDAAGNASDVSAEVSVIIDATPPDSPYIDSFSLDSGVADDGITNNRTPTFTIFGEAGTTITVLLDDVELGTAIESIDEPGTFTFTTAVLEDGDYAFTVLSTDAAGNISDVSDSFDLTIDATPPDAPTIDLVSADSIEISTEEFCTVTVYRNGVAVGEAEEIGPGVYSFTDEDYGPGLRYSARVTDAAGNTSVNSTLAFSGRAPVLDLGGGAETLELHINENTRALPTLTATDRDGDDVTFWIDESPDAAAFVLDSVTGELSLIRSPDFETPGDADGDGVYHVTVEAYDGQFSTLLDLTVVIDDVTAETIIGTEKNDRLVAANGNSDLNGMGGSDLLVSGNGNDRLDGGTGDDVLIGGAGDDVYFVDSRSDRVIETNTAFGATFDSGGKDTIVATTSYDLLERKGPIPGAGALGAPRAAVTDGRYIENVQLRGSDNISAFGNELDNRLVGNDGANRLLGRDGSDVLIGGKGNDTLEGGAGNDKLQGDEGIDRLIGGAGKDLFVFTAAPSQTINRDIISDFSQEEGDRIVLSKAVFAGLELGRLSADAFYTGSDAKVAQDSSDRIIYNTATGALYYDADGKGGAAAVQFATIGVDEHGPLSTGDFLIVA